MGFEQQLKTRVDEKKEKAEKAFQAGRSASAKAWRCDNHMDSSSGFCVPRRQNVFAGCRESQGALWGRHWMPPQGVWTGASGLGVGQDHALSKSNTVRSML